MLISEKKIMDDKIKTVDKIKYHNNIIKFKQNTNICKKISKEKDSSTYLKAANFEKWNNGTYDLWDVGFTLTDATEKKYNEIKSIEVILYNKGCKIASRITVDGGVCELMKDDIFYGGLNGQLSCSFKARDKEEVTRYWRSSPYDFTTPDKAEIKVCVLGEGSITQTYIIESHNFEINRPYLVCVK